MRARARPANTTAESKADRKADDSPSRLSEREGEEIDGGHGRVQPARASRAGRRKQEAGDYDRRNELSREIVRVDDCGEPIVGAGGDAVQRCDHAPK